MPSAAVHRCEWLHCRQAAVPPDQALQDQMNVRRSRVDEQQRRWYAAVESNRIGHGGDHLVAPITGRDPHTIQRGRRALAASRTERPTGRARLPGAGRPRVEKKTR
jgi:hypothetical protein